MTQAKKSTKKTAPKRAPKTTAKKSTKRSSKAKVLKLVDFMPEDERLAALKRAAERLDDVEQTQEVLKALQRLTVAYHELGERVEELEENAAERLEELRGRVTEMAAVKAAVEMSERLGGRASDELDEMLDRMGLMRKSVHEEEIELLKKRHKAARKAAETKARKAAEREAKKAKTAKAASA